MSNNQFQDSDPNEDINEEEVVQAILELGNDILRNLGVEERIDDIGVFFGDAFYIQFFQVAFPEIDFSNIQEAGNEQEMAENLQTLINLLGQQILRYDLSHITGEEIVQGNPEHCINLLQLVQEISVMVNNNQGASSQQKHDEEGPEDHEGEEDEDEDEEQMDDHHNKIQMHDNFHDMSDDESDYNQKPKQQHKEEEDDEAQLIQEKQAKKPTQSQLQQQNTSNNLMPNNSNAATKQKQSSAKRGRSYSDDKRQGGQFDMDDMDISNDFNINMDEEGDDDDDDHQHLQMLQQQQQKKTDQSKQSIKQQQNPPAAAMDNNYGDEEDDEEIDENDLKMYEQFLAQNQKDQQQLAMVGQQQQLNQNHFDLHDDEDEDNDEVEEDDDNQQQQQKQNMEEDEEEYDLDNIDYDDLDPQILEIAEQMGVHPKEVLKQMLKMQNEGYGDEDDEDEEEEMDEQALRQQLEQVNQMQQQQQPKQQQQQPMQQQQQKQSNAEPYNEKVIASHQQTQKQQQKQVSKLPHEHIPSNQDSYYSEGELLTRDKLAERQSYSAPYIIFNDCFEDKLCDTESNQEMDSAHTTTVLKNLEDQEMLAQQMAQANQEMMQQQQLLLQQQQMQQQQPRGNNQGVNLSSNSNNKTNKSNASAQKSNGKNNQMQQQQQMLNLGDEEDEDELDIDVGQKLEQLKNQQLQQDQNHHPEEDDEEDEDDGEEDDIMVDLDKLDDQKRQMVLEYLQQEYDQNPSQFPYPKELLDQQQALLKNKRQDTESVRDIKSDEMIVEDNSQQQFQIEEGQIQGGEEEIEHHDEDDDGEDEHQLQEEDLTPEQQQQLQVLLQQQQMQMLQQDGQDYEYGQEQMNEEDNGDQLDEIQQQMLQNYQLQQQMMMQQQQQQQQQRSNKKPKSKKGMTRPKSAGTRKKPPTHPQTVQQQSNLLSQQQMLQQEQLLQQQQLLAMLQQEGVDIENLDPNILQQLIVAQSQQQQQQLQYQNQMDQLGRPKTTKRKSSSKKKTSLNTVSANRNLAKLQPYKMPSTMKMLGPITPSTNYKSFNTNRSYNHTFSKKKRKRSSSKKQALTVNPSQQQYIGMPNEMMAAVDPNLLLAQQQQLQQQQQMPIQLEMPVLSEEYLNQLSEEQLQQLLEHQQQLMLLQQQQQQQQQIQQHTAMQQNSQMKKSIRPKSAKSIKTTIKAGKQVPQSYTSYYQPYMVSLKKKPSLKAASKGKNKKKKYAIQSQMDHQGVLMNNYFPALEAGNQLIANSQLTEDGLTSGTLTSKDQKYPKFSHDLVNNPNALAIAAQLANQDPIDEVSQEQEDAESQENKMSNAYPNSQQQQFLNQQQQLQQQYIQNDEQDQEDDAGEDHTNRQEQHPDQDIEQDHLVDQDQQDPHDGLDNQEEGNGEEMVELTDEQLLQLIQNAHNLTPEQQLQLQLILQQKMKNEMVADRAQSYQNIYNILMDNVKKAKDRLAHLGQPIGSIDNVEETDRRILRQKQEFEALYRQYQQEMKQKEMRKKQEDSKMPKKQYREQKIQQIKERKFQEDLLNHQKSLNYKRNAQQVRLCHKVYKLASELEKNKLLNEKKEFKENLIKKKQQSRLVVDRLESFYKNMISMLKEKIENEKFERKIASQAQQQAMSRMKKELNSQKRQEVERYLQLLKQEDEKYDFESSNLQRMEQEIIKLYKK